MSKKRIGILTSGGDCPGLNAVIRGAVKACHQLGYDCVGFLKGYEGLYDPVQYVHLTPNSTRGILSQGGTILGSTNKGRFAATVGVQDRVELDPELIGGVKQTIDQLGIDGLICVGGDGSLAVAQQFHENGINVVGVPKTIDNDLSATAFTFGFDSAIECATDALDRLHTTAASHERIMVLEVMGRHAGWIALHAGIAGGGDVILIPEIEWNYEDLCHKILHRESQGKKFTLVVVAEGAELPQGGFVGEQRDGQQVKLGGVGRAVATEIERRLHRETRLSVLGHLQRGGRPTTFDRVLATQFGAHAVRLIKEHRFGEMICSRPPEMTSVPIMEAVNVLRQVDPHGPAVQAARALGISFGDCAADELGHDVFGPKAAAAPAPEPTPTEPTEPELHEHSLGEDLEAAVAEEAAVATVVETDPAIAEPIEEATPAAELAAPLEPAAELISKAVADAPAIVAAPAVPEEVEPTAEDAEVEAVAETVLDLLEDADSAANGPLEEVVEESVEELPEADATVADAEPTIADKPVEETAASEPEASEVRTTPEPEPEVETSTEPADNPLADAQATLAERIAEAAQAKRDEAPEAVKVEPEVGAIDVAELVKQKLAAAQLEPATAKVEAEAPAKALSLAKAVATPDDGDPVDDARAALEAALAE